MTTCEQFTAYGGGMYLLPTMATGKEKAVFGHPNFNDRYTVWTLGGHSLTGSEISSNSLALHQTYMGACSNVQKSVLNEQPSYFLIVQNQHTRLKIKTKWRIGEVLTLHFAVFDGKQMKKWPLSEGFIPNVVELRDMRLHSVKM